MSRHRSEHKYINAESLWAFLDEQNHKLGLLSDNDSVESSELCKLIIMARQEMISAVCEHLHEHEVDLLSIIVDRHGILSSEECSDLIKKEYL